MPLYPLPAGPPGRWSRKPLDTRAMHLTLRRHEGISLFHIIHSSRAAKRSDIIFPQALWDASFRLRFDSSRRCSELVRVGIAEVVPREAAATTQAEECMDGGGHRRDTTHGGAWGRDSETSR